MRDFFKNIKPGLVGVEVGVACGGHAHNILLENKPEKLYLVDPYLPYGSNLYGEVHSNKEQLLGWKETAYTTLKDFTNIEWLHMDSIVASQTFKNLSLDFVYIDADHSFHRASQDIDNWIVKVKSGGIIGGHDYNNQEDGYGVTRAVDLWYKSRNIPIPVFDTDWWIFV